MANSLDIISELSDYLSHVVSPEVQEIIIREATRIAHKAYEDGQTDGMRNGLKAGMMTGADMIRRINERLLA